MKKIKVYLSKMNTEIGLIPVLSNFQTVNRPTQIYTAERSINNCNESIFFIVRPKDAIRLKEIGYNIQSIKLMPRFQPKFINYVTGTKLEQSLFM